MLQGRESATSYDFCDNNFTLRSYMCFFPNNVDSVLKEITPSSSPFVCPLPAV